MFKYNLLPINIEKSTTSQQSTPATTPRIQTKIEKLFEELSIMRVESIEIM